MTDTIRQRRALKYHSRTTKVTEPSVRPGSRQLPAEIFANQPDVLARLAEYENLTAAARTYAREARKLRDAADADDQNYRNKVREALGSGGDVSKLKSKGQELRAQADEQARLADRAGDLAKYRAGADLAAAMQKAAPELFPELDEQLATESEDVIAALKILGEKLESFGGTFKARQILSRLHLFGGGVGDWDPSAVMPAEFTAASGAIRELMNGPEELRQDEADLREFRAQNDRAQKANANGVRLDG